jgi:hypothetical protein
MRAAEDGLWLDSVIIEREMTPASEAQARRSTFLSMETIHSLS